MRRLLNSPLLNNPLTESVAFAALIGVAALWFLVAL
jgi:hypothetical protein